MRASVRLVAIVAAVSICTFGCTSAGATPAQSGATPAQSGATPAQSGATPAPSGGASPTTAESPSVSPGLSASPTSSTSRSSTPTANRSTGSTPSPIAPPLPTPIRPTASPLDPQDRILYRVNRDWWLIGVNGSGKRKVSDDFPQPTTSWGPGPWAVWAADGLSVHFVRWNVADKCRPQLINTDPWGGARTVVPAALHGNDANFVWSPDGTKIAFTRSQNYQECIYSLAIMDEHRDLLMMNADGTNIHTIKEDVDYSPDAWMPDGSAIIASTETGAALVDPATGISLPMAPVHLVKVSRDSDWVAFQSGGSLKMRPAGAGVPTLTMGPISASLYSYDWAPDGHSLAVVRDVVIGATTHKRLFRVSFPAGVGLDLGADGKAPSWSTDNVHFACATNSLILIFNVAGQPYVQVPNSGGAESVFWQP